MSSRTPARLVIAATASWTLFLAAHVLLNGRWWGWLVAAALPPLVFTAVPVLLLALTPLIRTRRPRLIVALVLAAALAVGFPASGLRPGAFWTASDDPAPAGAIRVFAWNTEYWHQDDDPDEFFGFLRARDADVYLLHEYLTWDGKSPLGGFGPVDDHERLKREFPGYEVVARGELLTLSRLPVVARPPVPPDPASAQDFDTVFPAAKTLRTDVRAGGRTVSLYNVHIGVHLKIVNPLGRDFWAFPRQADPQRHEQLRGLRADVAANPHPVVVAGDFNTSPAMADLEPLRADLTDAIAENADVHPVSWPAGRPLWRLDWAFTGGGVRVHRYAFTPSAGLSDHNGQELVVSPLR